MERRIQAIAFDLGETLIDETRHWAMVAQYAGVPELTLAGVLGGLIERREHHRSLFSYLQIESIDPNVFGYCIEPRDLYPDAMPTLHALKSAGYRLAITGNQPSGAAEQTRALGLPVDCIGTSSDWGVAKPDPGFFARLAREFDLAPDRIVYVGDRLDNDVLPAREAGMHAVFLRRGPWGFLHATWPEMDTVRYRIDGLAGLQRELDRINARP